LPHLSLLCFTNVASEALAMQLPCQRNYSHYFSGEYAVNSSISSPPQGHMGKATMPPLTVKNGLSHCLC